MRRLIILVCSGVLALGVLAGLSASTARAATVSDVTCVGTESGTISPGLLLTPQQVTVTSTHIFSPCVSTDPSLRSGTNTSVVPGVRSCLNLDTAGPGSMTFHWSNGRTSTFDFNSTVSNPAGEAVVTFTGAITSGEFTGDTAVMVLTSVTVNILACLAPPGVTSTSGTVELDITGA